jgi:mRNA interferase HigB
MGLCQVIGVRIIALSTLRAFISRSPAHADVREPVMAWYRQVRGADWATPADVKRAIGSASILNDGGAVSNLAGNKDRIVVWIKCPCRVVDVRFIGTPRQYDEIDAQTV